MVVEYLICLSNVERHYYLQAIFIQQHHLLINKFPCSLEVIITSLNMINSWNLGTCSFQLKSDCFAKITSLWMFSNIWPSPFFSIGIPIAQKLSESKLSKQVLSKLLKRIKETKELALGFWWWPPLHTPSPLDSISSKTTLLDANHLSISLSYIIFKIWTQVSKRRKCLLLFNFELCHWIFASSQIEWSNFMIMWSKKKFMFKHSHARYQVLRNIVKIFQYCLWDNQVLQFEGLGSIFLLKLLHVHN